jgi:hypothetical protein
VPISEISVANVSASVFFNGEVMRTSAQKWVACCADGLNGKDYMVKIRPGKNE